MVDSDEIWLSGVRVTPPARAAFREDLRHAFLGGSRGGDTGRLPVRWGRGRLVLVSLAAAAALVASTFLLPGETRWEVEGLVGSGRVELSSGSFGPEEVGRLADEITHGTQLSTLEQEVRLAIDERVSLRVLPHSRIRLHELADLGQGLPLSFVLEQGELYFQSHPGYPGDPILVQTGDVEVRASGTAFGVLVDERGTCTCVCDGVVTVLGRGSGEVEKRVSEGSSYLVFRGGTMAPKEMPFDPASNTEDGRHVRDLIEFVSARRH